MHISCFKSAFSTWSSVYKIFELIISCLANWFASQIMKFSHVYNRHVKQRFKFFFLQTNFCVVLHILWQPCHLSLECVQSSTTLSSLNQIVGRREKSYKHVWLLPSALLCTRLALLLPFFPRNVLSRIKILIFSLSDSLPQDPMPPKKSLSLLESANASGRSCILNVESPSNIWIKTTYYDRKRRPLFVTVHP